MTTKRQAQLTEALEDAALAGAKEITEFLRSYRGKDPDRLRRVSIAHGAVSAYARWRASQNNLASMMLIAARQSGISPEATLDICKLAGLLPEKAETALKVAR